MEISVRELRHRLLFCKLMASEVVATNPEVELFTLSVTRGEQDVPDIVSWFENHSEAIEVGENSS